MQAPAAPPRPAPALAAEPGYGPGLAPSDRPGHYTGLAESDMNKLYAATIGSDGQEAWQDPVRTRVRPGRRVGPGPNLKFTAWLTLMFSLAVPHAAMNCVVRLRRYAAAADVAAVTE